jgi:hypothetical protein
VGQRVACAEAGGGAFPAAGLRPTSTTSSSVSPARASASAPLRKLTRYSPGKRVRVTLCGLGRFAP